MRLYPEGLAFWPPEECERCERESAFLVYQDGTKVGSICYQQMVGPGELPPRKVAPSEPKAKKPKRVVY